MSYLEYPKQLLKTTVEGQIGEINSYLIRLVDTINHNLDSEGVDKILERAVSYNSSVGNSYSGLAGLTPDAKDKYYTTFANLKNLIISNASEVYQSETEPIVNKFEKTYKAISDEFGMLEQYLQTEIVQDADGIKITSEKIEGILGRTGDVESMVKYFSGYINAGWLDTQQSKWGIQIGKLADDFVAEKSDGTKVDLSNINQYFVNIEPTEIGFYFNNDKLCYISNDRLDFPNAHINGGSIQIGTDKNNNPLFSVDNDGNLSAQSGDIAGWIIAGSENASNGFWNYSLSNVVTSTTDGNQYAVFLRGNEGITSEGNVVFGVKKMSKTFTSTPTNWTNKAVNGVKPTDAEYTFRVYASGEMEATKAKIKGDITATSLTLENNAFSYSDLPGAPALNSLLTTSDKLANFVKEGFLGDLASGKYGIKIDVTDKKGLLEAYNAIIYGTIYASSGTIGSWCIAGAEAAANGFWSHSISNVIEGDTYKYAVFLRGGTATAGAYQENNKVIGVKFTNKSNASNDATWKAAGYNFYVEANGKLYANNAEIKGKITATSLTLDGATIDYSKISGDKPNTENFILKNGAIAKVGEGTAPTTTTNGSGTCFSVSSAGLLKASNAIIGGTIFAGSGLIGGWNINASYLGYLASDSAGYGKAGSAFINPAGTSSKYNIAGVSTLNWVFGVGNNFGISTGGICCTNGMMAQSAKITNNLLLDDNVCLKCSGNGGDVIAPDGYNVVLQWINTSVCFGADTKKTRLVGSTIQMDNDVYLFNTSIYLLYDSGSYKNCFTYSSNYVRIGNADLNSWIRGTTVKFGASTSEIYSVGVAFFDKAIKLKVNGSYRLFAQDYSDNLAIGDTSVDTCLYGKAVRSKSTFYLSNGLEVSSSDRNIKHDIAELDDRREQFFYKLKPVTFKFNNGDSGRDHTGFIAQEVKEAIIDSGLTTDNSACYCEWTEDGVDACGLRYGEFIALNTYMIQKLSKRIEELENKINS